MWERHVVELMTRPTHRRRRHPTTRAGRDIVEAILTASGLLLERDGIEGLTTNAIARVAGVSVGSLYQYFADKEAVVVELERRQHLRATDFAARHGRRFLDASLREALWRAAGLASSRAFGSVAMRGALLREVPRGWVIEATRGPDMLAVSMASGLIAARPDEARPGPALERARTAYRAVKGVVEGAVAFEPTLVGTCALRDELFQLVWRYVARDGLPLEPPEIEWEDEWPEEAIPVDEPLRERLDARAPARRAVELRKAASSRGRATRERILATAGRQLVQRGSRGVSARGIAREAGVSVGGLYRHFPNVASVLAALQVQAEARMREDLLSSVRAATGAPGPETAAIMVRSNASFDTERWAFARAALLELPRRWAHDARMGAIETGRRELGRLLGLRDDVRPADPHLMSFVASRALEGVLEARMLEGMPPPDEALLAELTDLLWRYVRADPR